MQTNQAPQYIEQHKHQNYSYVNKVIETNRLKESFYTKENSCHFYHTDVFYTSITIQTRQIVVTKQKATNGK